MQNKTSIQWTPTVKFISATTKEFWSKMIFEQQNQINVPEIFFSEKNFGKKIFEKKFVKMFWKKIFKKCFSTSSNYT